MPRRESRNGLQTYGVASKAIPKSWGAWCSRGCAVLAGATGTCPQQPGGREFLVFLSLGVAGPGRDAREVGLYSYSPILACCAGNCQKRAILQWTVLLRRGAERP